MTSEALDAAGAHVGGRLALAECRACRHRHLRSADSSEGTVEYIDACFDCPHGCSANQGEYSGVIVPFEHVLIRARDHDVIAGAFGEHDDDGASDGPGAIAWSIPERSGGLADIGPMRRGWARRSTLRVFMGSTRRAGPRMGACQFAPVAGEATQAEQVEIGMRIEGHPPDEGSCQGSW